SLQDDRAEQSGFEFRFRPDHFDHVSGNRASVAVRVRDQEVAPTLVPVVSEPSGETTTGPLPPEVIALLARYRPAYVGATWDDALIAEAIDDLRFLLDRGPRATPSLHRYLALVA